MVLKIDQDTPEWIEWRSRHVGASEAATIIGRNPYETPYELWRIKTGRAQGFSGNARTEAGKLMEPKARACYEIENDFVEMSACCVEHPTHSVIGASLDGLSPDHKIILEIKYPGEQSHEMARSGQVPDHYWVQMQHQLMCVPESDIGHYLSYRDGDHQIVFVQHDREFQTNLITAELAFWDLVLMDTPPPLTERDFKDCTGDSVFTQIQERILELKTKKQTAAIKRELGKLKEKAVLHGEHPKIRIGNITISTSQKGSLILRVS